MHLKNEVNPTHYIHQGGVFDGVWRECVILKGDNDTYYVEIITVFRFGDGPIITRFALSEPAFLLVSDTFHRLDSNPFEYEIN